MRYSTIVTLAALASALTCESHAVPLDVRYVNPGTLTFDVIKFTVDGQPNVEMVSGCPGPGTVELGPVCVAQIQLGEGTHTVQARAFVQSEEVWTGPSNTVTVQGAPEPGLGAGLGLGALGLAWAGRKR